MRFSHSASLTFLKVLILRARAFLAETLSSQWLFLMAISLHMERL